MCRALPKGRRSDASLALGQRITTQDPGCMWARMLEMAVASAKPPYCSSAENILKEEVGNREECGQLAESEHNVGEPRASHRVLHGKLQGQTC